MFIKIKNISFLIIFLTFFFLVTKYYFSEQNIIFTNKARSSYSLSLDKKNNLPILKNDTNNIIVYKTDLEEFKKKKKKRLWEKLISDNNE